MSARHTGSMTPRQIDIISLIARGDTRRAAADRLGLSELTVKEHLALLAQRIGIGEQAGMVGYAYLKRVLVPEPCTPVRLWRPYQLGILRRVASGESNQQIGAALNLSPGVVKYELKLLAAALGAKTRPHLVRRAIDTGALPLVAKGTP